MDDHEQYLRSLVARCALEKFNALRADERADLLEGIGLIVPHLPEAQQTICAFRSASQHRNSLRAALRSATTISTDEVSADTSAGLNPATDRSRQGRQKSMDDVALLAAAPAIPATVAAPKANK